MKTLTAFLALTFALIVPVQAQFAWNPYAETSAEQGPPPATPPTRGGSYGGMTAEISAYNPYTESTPAMQRTSYAEGAAAQQPSAPFAWNPYAKRTNGAQGAAMRVGGTYTGQIPRSNFLGGIIGGFTTTAAVMAQTAAQAAQYVKVIMEWKEQLDRYRAKYEQFKASVTPLDELSLRSLYGMLRSVSGTLGAGPGRIPPDAPVPPHVLTENFRATYPIFDVGLTEEVEPYEPQIGYMQSALNTLQAVQQHSVQLRRAQADLSEYGNMISAADSPMQIAEATAQLELYQAQEIGLLRQAVLMLVNSFARQIAYQVSSYTRAQAAFDRTARGMLAEHGIQLPAAPLPERINYEVGAQPFDARARTITNGGDGPAPFVEQDYDTPENDANGNGIPDSLEDIYSGFERQDDGTGMQPCPQGKVPVRKLDTNGDGYYDRLVCQ